ncbi:MAG: hypothetical protein M5R42_09090 [Rhodocyclaceae bacterium]|nr:hypothetical protein [Rhodocyclaceae bacterium]
MSALADLVLVVHFAIAGFIAAGFVLIPIGAAAGWRWVKAAPAPRPCRCHRFCRG